MSTIDHLDRIPDPILLTILNNILDVKSLGRCCSVSKRFSILVPQVDNILVRVDCVVSDDNGTNSQNSEKSRNVINSLFRNVFRSFHSMIFGRVVGPVEDSVTHHSPTQVLKNFKEIKVLKIELPSGELGTEDGALLKWKADFGSTLDNCVILGALSVIDAKNPVDLEKGRLSTRDGGSSEIDNGSIPESFYTNGGLKLRVVWTISSLIAASARHYLLQPIIAEHKTVNNLVLTDGDGQGVLCMNKEQLQELREKPLSASAASKRTLVPALNMRLWYAPQLELPDGRVMKGATLVAIRPSEQAAKKEASDGEWLSGAFEGPFGTAAKMLVKRRTYCLEMNSF